MKLHHRSTQTAFTLIEVLVVISIIAILMGLSIPALNKVRERTFQVTHVSNVKNFSMAIKHWGSDNGYIIPSPQYPGGHGVPGQDPNVPEQWDYTLTGTGLWLDGVGFYAAYPGISSETQEAAAAEGVDIDVEASQVKGDGKGIHLRGTVFESTQSFRRDPGNFDYYTHSYAMNSEIEPDPLFANSGDPMLTNKTLSRFQFQAQTMLFIENEGSSIVSFQDRDAIVETGAKRWSNKKIIASFLDGSTEAIDPK